MALNVLRQPLKPCSMDPITGFYRDGCCNTGKEDAGLHLVCIEADDVFLAFSASRGNDLSTPRPEYSFAGVQPGDHWCLCVQRWKEALAGGVAPKVRLESTHISTLEFVDLEVLKQHAVRAL